MKVVIIGAGTSAMNVADTLIHDKNLKLSGFVGTAEEEAKLMGKKLYGDVQFIGDHNILKRLKENNIVGFVAAIENNYFREKAYYEAVQAGLIPINVVSRHTVIDPSVSIGKGVVISAGCIISHGVCIGNNTYLGSGVIIEINTRIGDNCCFSTACVIGGECDIARNASFGMRSVVKPYIRIGKNQKVEPGIIISESLPDLIREEVEE